MRYLKLIPFVMTVLACAFQAQGQADSDGHDAVPRADIALGYTFIHANAPPGGCRCFGLSGGFASGSYRIWPWLAGAVEVEGSHANNISALNQNLTLLTYMGGPRVSLPGAHFSPFGEVLVGYAQGRDSYFPQGNSSTSDASSIAIKAGGGVDYYFYRDFGVRVKVQYLRTTFPNGTNNEQNHVVFGAGLVYHFGRKSLIPVPKPATAPVVVVAVPTPAPEPRVEVAFSCSTDRGAVVAGEMVEVMTNTMTEPDALDVQYSWTTTGGRIQGSGKDVAVDTTGLQPGRYRITGHASAPGHENANSSCDMGFRVKAAEPPPVPSSQDMKNESVRQNQMFHEAVKDAYFDYDKWNIRPDTQTAIIQAAAYLQQRPEISVLVGGYSDERGSSEYNLALGLKRSQATKEALVAAGVDPDRIQIVSYGKGSQVCTQGNEECWQQNRRAAFEMHP